MVEKHDRIWAIYPEYFDAGITRAQGRKIRKELAQPSPTLDELFDCARTLNLTPVKETNIAYPAFWWRKKGRLLVRKEWSKSETLEHLAMEFSEYRKVHGLPGTKDEVTTAAPSAIRRRLTIRTSAASRSTIRSRSSAAWSAAVDDPATGLTGGVPRDGVIRDGRVG